MKITLQAMINTIHDIGRTQRAGMIDQWRGDGSNAPSKNCKGVLYKIGRSRTGMKMYIKCTNGTNRVINWRMPQAVVTGVFQHVYQNNPKYQKA